jgi:hypothetical protein
LACGGVIHEVGVDIPGGRRRRRSGHGACSNSGEWATSVCANASLLVCVASVVAIYSDYGRLRATVDGWSLGKLVLLLSHDSGCGAKLPVTVFAILEPLFTNCPPCT